MNRSALLALLLLAIPYVAEGKASGRAAAVVPTCVHPKPSCYPPHCGARLRLRTSENETHSGMSQIMRFDRRRGASQANCTGP
jgi:hypothetical protein